MTFSHHQGGVVMSSHLTHGKSFNIHPLVYIPDIFHIRGVHKVSLQFQKFIINATDDVFYLDLFYCLQCLLTFFSSFTRLLHGLH